MNMKGFHSRFVTSCKFLFDFPNLEDSCELSSQLQTTLNVGEHPFAQMEDDIDRQRLLGNQPSYTRIDPEIAYMTSDLQKRERYERLLRRAKTEDLAEVSGIGCLYQCGVDKLGRPALLYLIYLLDPLVEKDYVIIYFHTITTSDNHPSMTWIRQVYDVLQYKHKKI
ncbi:Protein GDAP2-like protein [Armadillidium vulgare]|nr:Protein GDAP2-like protein [Armadillidium vulgare]